MAYLVFNFRYYTTFDALCKGFGQKKPQSKSARRKRKLSADAKDAIERKADQILATPVRRAAALTASATASLTAGWKESGMI